LAIERFYSLSGLEEFDVRRLKEAYELNEGKSAYARALKDGLEISSSKLIEKVNARKLVFNV
jgi:hypothetical protein